MTSPPSRGWTRAEADLWRRVAEHDFEVADQSPHFLARLARDKAWSLAFARGAIEEYRRFAFLCVVAGGVMTPSEEVDEVWHQHLTFSRDYWDVWCGQRLGRALHHDPSRGGSEQGAYFRRRYAATLAAYERWFGPPPEAWWPASWRRFRGAGRFRGVDRERAVVLPRIWNPAIWRDLWEDLIR
jgi:hypothetical protein